MTDTETAGDIAGAAASPEQPQTLLPKLAEFGELYLREKRMEAELKRLKAERAALAPAAEQELLQSGQARAPLATGVTVYTETKLYAGRAKIDPDGPDRDDNKVATDVVIEAMKANGLGHMVSESYNANTLKSYFRNQYDTLMAEKREAAEANGIDPETVDVEPNELLPPGLQGVLVVNEVRTLKAVKS